MSLRGLGLILGKITSDRANIAVAAQGLEERIGHHQVPVAIRMHAVAAGQIIPPPILGLGFGHGGHHRVKDVGVHDVIFLGDLAGHVAKLRQRLVIHFRCLGVVIGECVRVNTAR